MKTLNITKERFNKSRYFQKKYGALKFMSESGNLYKTEKGVVMKFLKEDVEKPDFGEKPINQIEPTGDVEQDFNNAMVALRDDNYEAFIEDLNTLAIDPKIEHLRDAIIQKFNSPDGVSVQFSKATAMDIRNIHPTQFEVDMEKSLQFPLKDKPQGIDDAFSGKPICIRNIPLVVAEVNGTNYIIDGHHRWSQVYCLNPDAQMTVRMIKSDMFKTADDVLKLVQMQLFIAKDGGELPQATVDSEYNLYTIQENAFKEWCSKTITEEAKQAFAKYIQEDPIAYMWNNVLVMRKEAQPTPNAHGRGDMPQTDKVNGEYMKPKATPVSEKTTMKKLNVTKERFEKSRYFQRKYGKLEYVSESGNLYKTNKGKVLMFKESWNKDDYDDLPKNWRPKFDIGEKVSLTKDFYEEFHHYYNDVPEKFTKGAYYMDDIPEDNWIIEDVKTIDTGKDRPMFRYYITNLDMDSGYEDDSIKGIWVFQTWIKSADGSFGKFTKKFTKESIDADPALVCPYCGGDNCEISIGSDDLNFTNLDRLQGETFNVECWCNDCDKPYNVTLELNVKDVYPNEDYNNL